MPTEKETINNLKNCSRFPTCSINKCPLDHEVESRTEIPREEKCHFTTKKKKKDQKGIRTLAQDSILVVTPKSNIEMLNKRNQGRWRALHKKNATE